MTISANYPTIRPSLLLDFANTKQLDPRITFSRATTGTVYDGKTTAVAEQNLVAYSQAFDNAAWNKTSTTVTANSTNAPDGTATAEQLIEASATGSHYLASIGATMGTYVVSGNVYTYSIFVKKGTFATAPSWIQIAFSASQFPSGYANFNLDTGAYGTTLNVATSTPVNVGNGWWRIGITATATTSGTSNAVNVFFTNNNDSLGRLPSYVGSITSDIYIWGAQLEQRSTVTAYTPTTTAPITNYIPALQTAAAGVPRFHHDPVTGESLGFLSEEQRTNLLSYSADFSNAAWIKASATITADAIVAPDGTLTGDMVVEDTSNTVRFIQPTTALNFTSGTTYTYSKYVKQNGRSIFYLYFETAAFPDSGRIAWFNLADQTTQVQSGVTASITSVGNGWYRCSVTATSDATATAKVGMGIPSQSMGSLTSYTGDGYSGIYIWGAQLEAGSFPSSYIPTVASQVTRSADSASMTGSNFSSWYRADEGTLYVEAFCRDLVSVSTRGFTLSDGTSNNYVSINLFQSTSLVVVSGATVQTAVQVNVNNLTSNKLTGAYKVNDFCFAANGTLSTVDTNGNIPSNINQANIGTSWAGSGNINGTIKRIAYYPKRLSNQELMGLTS